MFIETKKTKIVATLGPSCDSPEMIENLLKSGVNVIRFNMKHNIVAWHEERIKRAVEIATKLEKNIGILIDLQGPELRLETRDHQPVAIKINETLVVAPDFSDPRTQLVLPEPSVFEKLNVNDQFLIDDGFLEFIVVDKTDHSLTLKAKDDYVVQDHKGVNLPGVHLDFNSLIPADLEKLDMATRVRVDFVALSFCRSASDIKMLKEEIAKRNLNVHIVAKIESQQALDNLPGIIDNAEAVMVARGDLGIEVPIEELASWQKKIIHLCRINHKPVIVATQMLQSMVDNPRPTRAEATDVSNAVWDGADAVMLSGETATGKYPLKAVEAMAKIVAYNESLADMEDLILSHYDNTQAIVAAAVQLSDHHENVTSLIAFSATGLTPRVLASFRPKLPVFAITQTDKAANILSLSYGVSAFRYEFANDEEFRLPQEVIDLLESHQVIKKGSDTIVIHGSHWHRPGETNAVALVRV